MISDFHWRMCSSASKVADEMSEVSALQRQRGEVLRRVRDTAGADMCALRPSASTNGKILFGVRAANWCAPEHEATLWSAGNLYAQASRQKDLELQDCTRR
jgi:hypothetical protein